MLAALALVPGILMGLAYNRVVVLALKGVWQGTVGTTDASITAPFEAERQVSHIPFDACWLQ